MLGLDDDEQARLLGRITLFEQAATALPIDQSSLRTRLWTIQYQLVEVATGLYRLHGRPCRPGSSATGSEVCSRRRLRARRSLFSSHLGPRHKRILQVDRVDGELDRCGDHQATSMISAVRPRGRPKAVGQGYTLTRDSWYFACPIREVLGRAERVCRGGFPCERAPAKPATNFLQLPAGWATAGPSRTTSS